MDLKKHADDKEKLKKEAQKYLEKSS
jgi:hypothetical protein